MRGDFNMLRTVLCVVLLIGLAHSSGVHHLSAPPGSAPVVTAASSQYFERTFNRLVAAPPLVPFAPQPPQLVPVAPSQPHLLPVAPSPPQFVSIAPPPPVFVQTAQALPAPLPPQVIPFQAPQHSQNVPVQPSQPPQPAQNGGEPNVAIAIATAHPAPVATILLPPYPFGFPPGFGFIPQESPSNEDGKTQDTEQTTTKSTTQTQVQTTIRETETTTPLSTGSDTNFDQASSNQDPNFKQFQVPAPPRPQPHPQSSNQDVNFRQYLAPSPPRPQGQSSNQDVNFRQYLAPASPRPQPQPSTQNVNFRQYLAPAQRPQSKPQQQLPYALPEPHHHHHHHPHFHVYQKPQKLKTLVEVEKAPLAYIAPPPLPQFSHNHEAVKVVNHVHTFVPTRAKLIIRPVSHHHARSVPVKVVEYKHPFLAKASARSLDVRPNFKEAELTTLRPFPVSNTKPPRL